MGGKKEKEKEAVDFQRRRDERRGSGGPGGQGYLNQALDGIGFSDLSRIEREERRGGGGEEGSDAICGGGKVERRRLRRAEAVEAREGEVSGGGERRRWRQGWRRVRGDGGSKAGGGRGETVEAVEARLEAGEGRRWRRRQSVMEARRKRDAYVCV